MTLTGVGIEVVAGGTTAATNPQLQFFENFPIHLGANSGSLSNATLSVHAVNIPLSLSFNIPSIFVFAKQNNATTGTRSQSVSFGLYSLNVSTLSLANSASGSYTLTQSFGMTSWISMATSATQNITPGTWYFALNFNSSGVGLDSNRVYQNSSINPANAKLGGFLLGRMTASTGAMPASIATSALDTTGSDAIRQPYIIITA